MTSASHYIPDSRSPLEIDIAIRLQTATSYLCLLTLDDHRKQVYETAYRTENLNKWIEKHVSRIIAIVNRSVEKHGQGLDVPSVAAHWNDELHARGLNGTVRCVHGIKTEMEATQ